MKSVLIVDDCDVDHFICHDLIESLDKSIDIVDAYDGSEALNIVNKIKNQPSIILLDINMPGMNGFEFLAAYEKTIHPSSIVAMLSSSNQQDDIDNALSHACVNAFLTKPLDEDALAPLLCEA